MAHGDHSGVRLTKKQKPIRDESVRIAVIDSGWDYHSTAGVRVLPGQNFSGAEDSSAQDSHGHGTECVLLIAAMAPSATFVPIKVFAESLTTSVTALLKALEWAVAQDVDVINLSLGSDEPSAIDPLQELCSRAERKGALVIAASDPAGRWRFPASFDSVISVENGDFAEPYEFSYAVDNAPECRIGPRLVRTRSIGGVERIRNGSSYAAAQLSGIAAIFRQSHPNAGADQFRRFLASNQSTIQRGVP
ncbi:S8 family serine peptidase [Gemmatimonas aurantiaca]|uniref:S8 family serine peptidase n=1 Tax=Gemmatimonas aurantiaca TaxID=173480 RepID=UPI00301CAFF4